MAEPLTQVERRLNAIEEKQKRHQEAIETMSAWLVSAQTGFGQKDHEGIMDILHGDRTETTSEDSASTAD